jgi:hypothetical protein
VSADSTVPLPVAEESKEVVAGPTKRNLKESLWHRFRMASFAARDSSPSASSPSPSPFFTVDPFNAQAYDSRGSQLIREMSRRHDCALQEVESVYSIFRRYGTAAMELADFQQMVYRLLNVNSGQLPEQRITQFWKAIEVDGTGEVVFEEFFPWYRKHFVENAAMSTPAEPLCSSVTVRLPKMLEQFDLGTVRAQCDLDADSSEWIPRRARPSVMKGVARLLVEPGEPFPADLNQTSSADSTTTLETLDLYGIMPRLIVL